VVREAVYNGHIGMIGKVRNRAMRIRADHHRIDKAGEHARAELAHALFKRKARAGRSFFKNHRQCVAVQRRARVGRAFGQAFASGLHRMGVIENGAQLCGRNISEGDEMGHGVLTLRRSVQKA